MLRAPTFTAPLRRLQLQRQGGTLHPGCRSERTLSSAGHFRHVKQQNCSSDSDPNRANPSTNSSSPSRQLSSWASLVWPRPTDAHKTWYHLSESIIPEGWSNNWRTWSLRHLFGSPYELGVDSELTIAHELPQPIKPIMYSSRSSSCFVFQAGDNADFYHWDDDKGILHRVLVEPRTTAEELVKNFTGWTRGGPGSKVVSRTKAGQEMYNKIRREQNRRDAEAREQTTWGKLDRMPFELLNTCEHLMQMRMKPDAQMSGFNTHDEL